MDCDKLKLLISIDAQRLYERIKYREEEYMKMFSLKRTRQHFEGIFYSRYDGVKIEDLQSLDEDIICAIDNFYSKIDDMKWFLNSTEDMPVMVSQTVKKYINEIDELYVELQSYLNFNAENLSLGTNRQFSEIKS